MRPIGKILVILLAILGGASLIVAPVDIVALPSDNVKDISSFVECLNGLDIPDTREGNVSDTVQCMPKGCKVTLTMSTESAQAACSLGGSQLPRVLLNCPGPGDGLRFRPSYLLCPINSKSTDNEFGLNRIEIGEDTEKFGEDLAEQGKMKMADVPIPPVRTSVDEVISKVIQGSQFGTKACNGCHGSGGAMDEAQLSRPIDPFGKSQFGTRLLPFIIFTDEPGKKDRVKPMGEGTDGKALKAQSLAEICESISENKQKIAAEANDPEIVPREDDRNPNLDPEILLALCQELNTYQMKRACGKAQGLCTGLLGGGKFLEEGAVSILRLDLSGEAAGDMLLFRFIDIDGNLSGYNYLTRTHITSVVFSSLEVTSSEVGGFGVEGAGTALVNGESTRIQFSAIKTTTFVTFTIRNADTGMVLASGTGEPGRHTLELRFNEP